MTMKELSCVILVNGKLVHLYRDKRAMYCTYHDSYFLSWKFHFSHLSFRYIDTYSQKNMLFVALFGVVID